MKNAFSISLIILLMLSTTGIHFGYAQCTMNDDQNFCSITSNESCCTKKVEDNCCTNSKIEQDGTFYDFVVNQDYKVVAPAICFAKTSIVSCIPLLETTTSISVLVPPPIFINNQAVFQVFLC